MNREKVDEGRQNFLAEQFPTFLKVLPPPPATFRPHHRPLETSFIMCRETIRKLLYFITNGFEPSRLSFCSMFTSQLKYFFRPDTNPSALSVSSLACRLTAQLSHVWRSFGAAKRACLPKLELVSVRWHVRDGPLLLLYLKIGEKRRKIEKINKWRKWRRYGPKA